MFIISLTYVKPLAEVDALLEAHGEFLQRRYRAGDFLLSGRKVPRTGGVILAAGSSMQDVLAKLEDDPFKRHGIARYEVTEFVPTMWHEGMREVPGLQPGGG